MSHFTAYSLPTDKISATEKARVKHAHLRLMQIETRTISGKEGIYYVIYLENHIQQFPHYYLSSNNEVHL
jgi:4'-phosphopantetheinyl transferase EntD